MVYENNIIDAYTKFKNGANHYVSIPEFLYLMSKLKSNGSIQKSISFNPFYEHKDFLLEIDERMLYIESRDSLNEIDTKEFYESQKCEEDFYNVDIEKRYFLIQRDDVTEYKKTLDRIISYLDELIPYILQRLKSEYNIKEAGLLFGNVCFEIYYE